MGSKGILLTILGKDKSFTYGFGRYISHQVFGNKTSEKWFTPGIISRLEPLWKNWTDTTYLLTTGFMCYFPNAVNDKVGLDVREAAKQWHPCKTEPFGRVAVGHFQKHISTKYDGFQYEWTSGRRTIKIRSLFEALELFCWHGLVWIKTQKPTKNGKV